MRCPLALLVASPRMNTSEMATSRIGVTTEKRFSAWVPMRRNLGAVGTPNTVYERFSFGSCTKNIGVQQPSAHKVLATNLFFMRMGERGAIPRANNAITAALYGESCILRFTLGR